MNRLWLFLILVLAAAGINTLIAGICSSMPFPVEFNAKRTAALRTQHWEHIDATGDSEAESLRILGAYTAFGRELRVIRPHIDEPVTVFEHYSGWPLNAFKGVERVVTHPSLTQGKKTGLVRGRKRGRKRDWYVLWVLNVAGNNS